MVELEIIPGLSLVPRLAGPWRANTLSRARLPRTGFWSVFSFLFFFLRVDLLKEKLRGDTYWLIHEDIVALGQLTRETCVRIVFNVSWLSLKPHSSWKQGRAPAARRQPALCGRWFGNRGFTKGMSSCAVMTHVAAGGMGRRHARGPRVLLRLLQTAEVVSTGKRTKVQYGVTVAHLTIVILR